jgi:hypothetical protein
MESQVEILCMLVKHRDLFAENVGKLRLSDFQSTPVRLVFEVLLSHYRTFGSLPGTDAFPNEMLEALKGKAPDGKLTIETEIPKPLVPMVATAAGQVFTALSKPTDEDSAYFKLKLKDYLYEVRMLEVRGGLSASEQVEKVAEIKEGVDEITGGEKRGKAATMRKRVLKRKDEKVAKRFGTGLWPVDIRTKMGMELGEIGCIISPSGVGKSNLLLNFAVNSSLRGLRSLFFTLEVSEDVIDKRMQAMIGNFKISLMDKFEEDWPKDELDRYNYMMSDEFPNMDYCTVNSEYVSHPATCADIDREIKLWKKEMKAQGLSDEECPFVFIDYLKQIDPKGVASPTDNTNTKFGNIMQQIKRMALKYNVVIWTAQQVNRLAQKAEHVGKEHIADSIAIVNHCDMMLGLVPVAKKVSVGRGVRGAKMQSTTVESEDDTMDNHSDTDRLMNIDFVKLRNSGETGTFCTVYQGPSLRFWTSMEYANNMLRLNGTKDYARFFTTMRPKEAKT